MEKCKWIFREKENEGALPEFFRKVGIPAGVARILRRRGISSEEALTHFLKDSWEALADPFLMKGMREAVNRLLLARERGERVVVYGDYDVDGITSTSILYRYFKKIGIDTGFYIPGREGEGYGLNTGAVEKLAGEGYNLLITVDCGISSAELIDDMADRIDFIVTDHHLPPERLPAKAFAVVNPHQKDCPYPYEDLAGCGVAFTVCRALTKELSGGDYTDDVELVALGTIADMVPLTGENRILVREGLARFPSTKIKGLAALLRAAGVISEEKAEKKIAADQVSFGLAPRINAAGRIAHAKIGVELMMTDSEKEAAELAETLCGLNVERQGAERAIFEEALTRLGEVHKETDMALVVDGHDWHPGVIGIVASRIVERMHRPTLVVTIHDGVGKGSCRSVPGFSIYDALTAQKELLLQFGGHPMAAGFSIKEENIPEFRRRLAEYAAEKLTPEDCVPQIEIEQEMPLSEVTLDFIRSLALLEPCGCENPKPIFATSGVVVESARRMGAEDRHFKCLVSQGGVSAEAVFWNPGEDPCRPGELASIAYEPEIHEWYGERVQLIGRAAKETEREAGLSLDRDFLVEVFLTVRNVLGVPGAEPAALLSALSLHFRGKQPEARLRAGCTVLKELGILSLTENGGRPWTVYHPAKEKLDLSRSATFRKYSR